MTASERGARKKRKRKEKIIIFRSFGKLGMYLGDGRIDLKQKEEEYILTRFFFYKIFSLREK